MGLFEKLKTTLSKTRHSFGESINTLVSNFRAVDEDFLEELEETLIMADAGVEVTESIIDELRQQAKINKISSGDHVRELLMKIIAMFSPLFNACIASPVPIQPISPSPW